MKKLNLFLSGLSLLSLLIFTACASGNGDTDENADTTITQLEEKMNDIESSDTSKMGSKDASLKLGKEYTAKYICPDHCKGSGSDKAGTCTTCGMDLIENPNFQQQR